MTLCTPKFEQQADLYDKATPIQSEVALFLAKQIWAFNYQEKEQLWLDIGCGTGKLSQAVLTEFLNALQRFPTKDFPFYQVNGLDNSQSMLQLWQKNCVSHFDKTLKLSVKNIFIENKLVYNAALKLNFHPVLADMTALPFANRSVDTVMSSFALHWATPQVIGELGRVVKKGGSLYLAIPVEGSFNQVSQRFPELPIYSFLPSNDWQQAINELIEKRQGKIHFLDERLFSHTYSSLRTLLSELKNMGGAVSGQVPMNPSVLRHYLKDKSTIDLDYQIFMVGIQLN